MSSSVYIEEYGGPEVLRFLTVDPGRPGPHEVLIAQHAIGVNFRDVYERRGQLRIPLPGGLGMEAAGIVLECGAGVDKIKVGDRVAYGLIPGGAYAERRCVPASRIVHLPVSIDFETAAAGILKGMTAEYLLERCYKVQAGEWVLLHSASGGVGLLASQWLKHLGARVIGTVGSEGKVEAARAAGCDHVVVRNQDSFLDRVLELTDGAGVPVVYDPIGRDTLEQSIKCVRKRGTLVSFGASSGEPAPLALTTLLSQGSIYVCRPGLDAYVGTRPELTRSAERVFDLISRGTIDIHIGQRFHFDDVRMAHQAIESGKTCGALVLLA